MEEDDFGYNDLSENSLSQSLFNMMNPMLVDISNDNNNNVAPNAIPLQNHHEVQQGNNLFSISNDDANLFNMTNTLQVDLSNNNVVPNALPRQNYHGVPEGNYFLPIFNNDLNLFNMSNPTSNGNVVPTSPLQQNNLEVQGDDTTLFNMSNVDLSNSSNVIPTSLLQQNNLEVQQGYDTSLFNISDVDLSNSNVTPMSPLQQNNLGVQHDNDTSIFNMSNVELSNSNVQTSLPQQNHYDIQQGNDTSILNMSNVDLTSSNVHTSLAQQNNHGVQQGPFSDPMVQDQQQYVNNNFSFEGARNMEMDTLQTHGNQPANENMGSINNNFIIPLPHWPPTPIPFYCSCCQVLREIVYTNGTSFDKLEIHGRIGFITHAIHRQNITPDPSNNNIQYQMIDFSRKSNEEIKNFLEQHCRQRDSLGHTNMQDPMSAYYEALSTGLDWAEDLSEDDAAEINQNNSGGAQVNGMEQGAEIGTSSSSKSPLAIQRARVGKMHLKDLSNYFHLPIQVAARKMNLCPSVVKKISRKSGLRRWPYRKLRSITKQIEILREDINSTDAMVSLKAQAELKRLKQEMVFYCRGIEPTGI